MDRDTTENSSFQEREGHAGLDINENAKCDADNSLLLSLVLPQKSNIQATVLDQGFIVDPIEPASMMLMAAVRQCRLTDGRTDGQSAVAAVHHFLLRFVGPSLRPRLRPLVESLHLVGASGVRSRPSAPPLNSQPKTLELFAGLGQDGDPAWVILRCPASHPM